MRGHNEPPTPGQQPGAQAVAAAQTLVPRLVEPIHREAGSGENRLVERLPATQPLHEGRQATGRVPPRQLDHGRGCEAVRRLAPWSATPAGRCRGRRDPGQRRAQPRGSGRAAPRRSHSPAAQLGVALVEPERNRHPHRLVQGQMGQLVAKNAWKLRGVGAQGDGAASRGWRSRHPTRARVGWVSESSTRPSRTTTRRSESGSREPRPGHCEGRSASRASATASGSWSGHATAVTRPTCTAVGTLRGVGRLTGEVERLSGEDEEESARRADCAGPHLRRRPGRASPYTAWPRD